VPISWIVLQPNLDWPLVHWVFVAQVALISAGALGAMGGWLWIRHFAFPLLLLFTAVPWLDQLEAPVMQFLMREVAAVAALGLDFLGITALPQGNVLEVAGGKVGVDEACSGIRSLQGAIASSLILGEIFRFSLRRRIALFVISIVVALGTNVLRVAYLAWNAAERGLDAVHEWHDSAGLTILLVCLGAIFLAALLLDRGLRRIPLRSSGPAAPHSLPRWFVPVLIGSVAVAIAGAEFWYYDPAKPPVRPWMVSFPAEHQSLALRESAWTQLRYDAAEGAAWADADGPRWLCYFFDWDYGPTYARIAAQMHRPDICLPAAGQTVQAKRGVLQFSIGNDSLPFKGYVMRDGDRLLYVYHGVWPFRSATAERRGALAADKQEARWKAVLHRERGMGQQAVEIAVWGCRDVNEADSKLAALLPKLLWRRPPQL
jgi:exosortase